MMTLTKYLEFIFCMIPVYSALTCGFLTILSNRDSLSRTEVKLKRILAGYLMLAAFGWYCTFTFGYLPVVFVYLQPFCYFSFLAVQVLFYHFFYILTQTTERDGFNRWHYALPVFLSGVMLVWSLFLPFDVQLLMVEGRKNYIPPGYEWYARFFFTKPEMRLCFSLVYITLTLVRLHKYYQAINRDRNLIRQPERWVWFLIALAITSVLSSLFASVSSRDAAFRSPMLIFTSVIIMMQHIILTFYTVRRQFLLYIVAAPAEMTSGKDTGQAGDTAKKTKTYLYGAGVPLTRESFERYIKTEKPYLSPVFKMTNLEGVFGTNRTYISHFINETYGINFNRYVNRLRLKEMEKLLKKRAQAGKPLSDLIRQAGFTDSRHYHRAVAAEKQEEKA